MDRPSPYFVSRRGFMGACIALGTLPFLSRGEAYAATWAAGHVPYQARTDVQGFIPASPANFTFGREGRKVDTVVVHYTANEGTAWENCMYFSRPGANASAHYFISRDGAVWQSVSEDDTAWHAGHWPTNQRSVGIEVVSDGSDFTWPQVSSLHLLVADLMDRHRIRPKNVIRHFDVTGKWCPKPYVDEDKWNWLHQQITREDDEMNEYEHNALSVVYSELVSRSDPSGRGQNVTIRERIAWMGARQDTMDKRLTAIEEKLDHLTELLEQVAKKR